MTYIHQRFKSIIFKIGITIILAEMVVLAVVGFFYINRFSDQVDRRISAQVKIPGKLMHAGLLSYNSVGDRETIRQLVGEKIIEALIVGVSSNVFFSSDSADRGRDVASIPDLDTTLFDVNNPREAVIFEGANVVSITPILGPDRNTLRMFLYIKAGTGEAEAEKAAMLHLFLFGSGVTVVLTSLIIILSLIGSFVVYRPFCQLICPFGFVSWLVERFSIFQIQIDEKTCTKCEACIKACPLNTAKDRITGKKMLQDCFSCGRCLNVCPVDAIRYKAVSKNS